MSFKLSLILISSSTALILGALDAHAEGRGPVLLRADKPYEVKKGRTEVTKHVETWTESSSFGLNGHVKTSVKDPWRATLTGLPNRTAVVMEKQAQSKPIAVGEKSSLMSLRKEMRNSLQFEKIGEATVKNPKREIDPILGPQGEQKPYVAESTNGEALERGTPVRVRVTEGNRLLRRNLGTTVAAPLAEETHVTAEYPVLLKAGEKLNSNIAPAEAKRRFELYKSFGMYEGQPREEFITPGGEYFKNRSNEDTTENWIRGTYAKNKWVDVQTKSGADQKAYSAWLTNENVRVTPAYVGKDGKGRADILGLTAVPIGSEVKVINEDLEARNLPGAVETLKVTQKGSFRGSFATPIVGSRYRMEVLVPGSGADAKPLVRKFTLPDPASTAGDSSYAKPTFEPVK